MQLSEIVATSLSTTASVLLIVLAGAIIVRRMTDGGTAALKGIVYVTALITLPCLLFTHLANGFDLDRLRESWPILVFAVVQISTGVGAAMVCRRYKLLPEEYGPLLVLGLCSQNAVAFPYALLAAIRGVAWYDGTGLPGVDSDAAADNARESLEFGETLLFMFNICTSLTLWSLGNRTIEIAAERRAQEAAGTVVDGSSFDASQASFVQRARRFYKKTIRPALSIPVQSSLFGILFGLVPPLKWLVTDGPVTSTIASGMSRAGDACIPLTMIVLGCSLAAQRSKKQQHKKETKKPDDEGAATKNDDDAETAGLTDESDGAAIAQPTAKPAKARPPPLVLRQEEAGPEPGDIPQRPSTAPPGAQRSPVEAPVRAPSTVAGPPRTQSLTPKLAMMVPIEQNPSFDLPPLDSDDSDDANEVRDDRPLAISSLRDEPSGTAAAAAADSSTTTTTTATLQANKDQRRFTLIVMFVRFVVMPTVALTLMAIAGMRPGASSTNGGNTGGFKVDKARVTLLVVLFEAFAPSAVNGGVICTLHGYYPERHGLMLAAVYFCSVVPCVVWVAIALWFLA